MRYGRGFFTASPLGGQTSTSIVRYACEFFRARRLRIHASGCARISQYFQNMGDVRTSSDAGPHFRCRVRRMTTLQRSLAVVFRRQILNYDGDVCRVPSCGSPSRENDARVNRLLSKWGGTRGFRLQLQLSLSLSLFLSLSLSLESWRLKHIRS